jgi:hypothetical protein
MSSFDALLRGTRAAYTRRVVALAPLLAVGGAVAAGCGGAGTSSTTTQSPQTPAQAAFAYSRCIRSHGVPSFPDPQVSTSGGSVKIAQRASPTHDVRAFQAAEKACRALLPQIAGRTPAQQRARAQDLLAFARCLRAHGLAGFPDPGPQGQLTLQTVSAAGVDVHSRGFYDAARQCVGVTNGAITLADVAAATRGGH